MSGSAPLDPGPPASAMQSACVAALAGSSLLALGAVRDGVLAHASTALLRMFGLSEGATRGRFAELVEPADRERVARALFSPGGGPVAFRAVRADGSLFEAELSTVHAALPDGPATVVALSDLTERERAARQLSYLALVDPVTGLPNRQAFVDRLQAALSMARRAGRATIVMLIELDGLEGMDATTHDALLRAIGSRLRQCLRETDTIARLGQARLGIILPRAAERGQAALPAMRLLAALTGLPECEDASCRASIGIAAYPEDAPSAETLLERARAALADARRAGEGRLAFASPAPAAGPGLPEYVRWSPRYEVGVEVVDGQHRHLLELINCLGDSLRSGRDFDQLVDALKELVRYTEHHFATEERLMYELGAHGERHRAEHRRLLDSLMQYTLRLDTEGVSQSSRFLQEWLFHHIDEVDRPFAAFLRNHGVS